MTSRMRWTLTWYSGAVALLLAKNAKVVDVMIVEEPTGADLMLTVADWVTGPPPAP
jgi:hypothetical protein